MPASGAEHSAPPEAVDLPAAAAGFTSSGVRYLSLLAGLFGLELRETGHRAIVLGILAVAFISACLLAYLFLLIGLTIVLAGWLGGAWGATLLALFVFHIVLAAVLFFVLLRRARRPLFPGTCEAIRREAQKFS